MTPQTPPRVAVITPNPTTYRVPFFSELARSGRVSLKVFFLTRGSASRPWTVEVEGFEHEFLPEKSIPVGGKDNARYRMNPSMIRRLRQGHFHCVAIAGYNHFTTQAAILWCIFTGTPWCLMSESHVAKPRGPVRVAAKKLLLGPILRTMGAGMVTGTLARLYLESFGVPRERIFVVANTPDVAYFREAGERLRLRRDEIRATLGLSGKKVILFVGRLLEEKGLVVLFDAYGIMKESAPDAALAIVGDGARRPRYEALAGEKDLTDVHFLGFKSQPELPEIYAASDVFVLPSLVEPWGVVVNEAMASGLPVVASDQVGASADLVRSGENGFVVPAGESEPLAARVLEILADEGRRAAMGARSIEIVSSWDYAMSVDGFVGAVTAASSGRKP